MFKKNLLAAVPILLSSFAASAESHPDCQHENAFGKVTTSAGDVLADFCVDRETGSISGPFSVLGLTLTKDDGLNFTFEDLGGGSANVMQIAPVLTATYHNSNVEDQSPEVNVMSGPDFFVGFIYNDLATPQQLADSFYVHLADGASIDGMTPLGFTGQATFVDGQTTISVIDNTQYGTAKGTEGSISLTVSDNGTISGEGHIFTNNIRSAGYSQNEWVSMSIRIDELRGFATGSTGQVIKSYALVTADIIDAEGDNHQSTGSMEIFLYDPQIWE